MPKRRRRPMHYNASSLLDGTILFAYPVRKPMPKTIKRDGIQIDQDGVCVEWVGAGEEVRDVNNESRDRLQDLISNRLNLRRTVREMILPELTAIRAEMSALQRQLDRIERMLGDRPTD